MFTERKASNKLTAGDRTVCVRRGQKWVKSPKREWKLYIVSRLHFPPEIAAK